MILLQLLLLLPSVLHLPLLRLPRGQLLQLLLLLPSVLHLPFWKLPRLLPSGHLLILLLPPSVLHLPLLRLPRLLPTGCTGQQPGQPQQGQVQNTGQQQQQFKPGQITKGQPQQPTQTAKQKPACQANQPDAGGIAAQEAGKAEVAEVLKVKAKEPVTKNDWWHSATNGMIFAHHAELGCVWSKSCGSIMGQYTYLLKFIGTFGVTNGYNWYHRFWMSLLRFVFGHDGFTFLVVLLCCAFQVMQVHWYWTWLWLGCLQSCVDLLNNRALSSNNTMIQMQM